MTIRPVVPSDLPQLPELAATTIRETFGPPRNPGQRAEEYSASDYTEEQLRNKLAEVRATFFVAEDGQLAGVDRLLRHAPPRFIYYYFWSGSDRQRNYWLLKSLPTGKNEM